MLDTIKKKQSAIDEFKRQNIFSTVKNNHTLDPVQTKLDLGAGIILGNGMINQKRIVRV